MPCGSREWKNPRLPPCGSREWKNPRLTALRLTHAVSILINSRGGRPVSGKASAAGVSARLSNCSAICGKPIATALRSFRRSGPSSRWKNPRLPLCGSRENGRTRGCRLAAHPCRVDLNQLAGRSSCERQGASRQCQRKTLELFRNMRETYCDSSPIISTIRSVIPLEEPAASTLRLTRERKNPRLEPCGSPMPCRS